MSSAASTTCSSGSTRDTSPHALASSAVIKSPVRQSSMALDLPTARVSRWVPPAPGMVPSLISGWPNWAFAPARMMSHIIASSQPPPSANPLTAAMIGLRMFLMLSQSPRNPLLTSA
eukprot:Amastigsp_a508445_28.p2 type:complete len:117 gc:universal Amastigsp_a508445_28:672-322(-)